VDKPVGVAVTTLVVMVVRTTVRMLVHDVAMAMPVSRQELIGVCSAQRFTL
jgi:hypothetical protein